MKNGFDYTMYKKWAQSLGTVEQDFRTWLELFLIEEAYRVMEKGKPRTPVDTGFLKNSWYVGDISWNGNNLQVEIGLSADYASYQEYGTSRFDGKYMLTISIDEVQRQLPARFNQAWFQFLKSKGVI